MNLYVAAPLLHAHEADAIAREVALVTGCAIVSRWHHTVSAMALADRRDPAGHDERAAILKDCIDGLRAADVVVVLADRGRPRATLCEAGFAIALGKLAVWVHDRGEGRCLFDSGACVCRIDSGHMDDDDIAGAVVEIVTGAMRGRMATVPDDRATDRGVEEVANA